MAPVRRRCCARSLGCTRRAAARSDWTVSRTPQMGTLERAKRVALVTGDEVLLDALRVRDVVSIGRFPHHRWWQWQTKAADDAAIESALAAVRIEEFADRLFSTLSAGERQRVWIALGLAQETPILLLGRTDESWLDRLRCARNSRAAALVDSKRQERRLRASRRQRGGRVCRSDSRARSRNVAGHRHAGGTPGRRRIGARLRHRDGSSSTPGRPATRFCRTRPERRH